MAAPHSHWSAGASSAAYKQSRPNHPPKVYELIMMHCPTHAAAKKAPGAVDTENDGDSTAAPASLTTRTRLLDVAK